MPTLRTLLLFMLVSSFLGQARPDCIEFDENTDAVIIPGCVCDASCELCGYYNSTVSGPEDCFTCPDGFNLTVLFEDGSGTCDEVVGTGTGVDITDPPTFDSTSTGSGICYMIFQMADNDLEEPIRGDLSEMTKSEFIKNPSTTSWVYFDALNEGGEGFTGGTLADVYNSDGTALTERFEGSQYLRWDHDLGKMVVDTTLVGEQDSDNPAILQAFVEYAVSDCVAKGKSEYFLALSSHGGGFAGFGADDHESRRRLEYQPPGDIRSAIEGAFSSVPGAPSKLDVLGFDACLMQSVGALDDFRNITKYYLASEATEPGHGWAYNELSATDSALELGKEIVSTFVASTQNYGFHDIPKTLALVDTSKFGDFLTSWEALCAEMTAILQSGNDGDFHANLNRARGNTVSFEGSLDYPGVKVPAAMDIGSFMTTFQALCVPDQSTQLYTLLSSAMEAYNNMMVESKTGPGTAAATGMHITWVSKQEFLTTPSYYEPTVFADPPIIMGAPNYLQFVANFYLTPTPDSTAAASVCGTSTTASRSAASPSELLVDPNIYFVDDINTEIRSEIARNVDFVFVEYGIDVTNWLDNEGFRRRLNESALRIQSRWLEAHEGVAQPRSLSRRQAIKWRYRDSVNRRRRTQQEELFGENDYFLIYGGDVPVVYNGSNIVASWDSSFFWIEYGEDIEPVYAFDDGNGQKSIPVCYFSQSNPITTDQIDIGITVQDAVSTLGCQEGYLSFSAAVDSDGQVGLYVYRDGKLSQVPRGAGNIVPISYIEYSVDGAFLDELLGGFSSVVIPWTTESEVTVYYSSDALNLQLLNSDTAFMEALAYDEDTNVTDPWIFPYSFVGAPDTNNTDTGDDSSTPDDGDDSSTPDDGDDSSAATSRATKVAFSVISTFLLWLMLKP